MLDDVNYDFRKKIINTMLNPIKGYSKLKSDENAIWLGINLSAMLNDQENFTKFSLYNISYLMNNNRLDDAEKAINEWRNMLPENKEIQKLQKKLRYLKGTQYS